MVVIIFVQVMREYTSKVDKLEEAENQRATEAKEENNKPIVMGKLLIKIFLTQKMMSVEMKMLCVLVRVSMWLWLSPYFLVTAR